MDRFVCPTKHASSNDPVGDDATILEARTGRLPPGQGVLPLSELLDALPAGTAFSVDMPLPALPTGDRIELAYRSTQDPRRRAPSARVSRSV